MALCRKKCLCYNYNERYDPNHKCQAKFFLHIASDDDDLIIRPPPNPGPEDPPSDSQIDAPFLAQLSLYALSSHTASVTLRVTSSVNGHDMVVLIDGGNIHSFIQDRMVHFLNIAAQPTQRLSVMIGNGSEIGCNQVCKNVPILVQGHQFYVDLYVMALGGADMVFGVAWLKLLVPITTDYSHVTMSFTRNNKSIMLQGCIGPGPTEATHGQVKHVLHMDRVAALFHLQL